MERQEFKWCLILSLESNFRRLRIHRIRRAFCLGVMAFVSLITGQPLDFGLRRKLFGAFCICHLERSAAVIAEVKFNKVAVQMGFSAMLTDADRATLEH